MSNKQLIKILLLVIAIVFAGFIFLKPKDSLVPSSNTKIAGFDGKNSSFTIDGRAVHLVNGVSVAEVVPNSASKVTTRYFGNEAYGDVNGDGTIDTAFLVSQNTGGSGLFYYVVVALTEKDGYKITNAFFIGDRIAPQSTEINSSAGELLVNFAERKDGEPMSTPPSVGATLLLKVTPQGVLEGLMK